MLGLRGAASIVFAILILTSETNLQNDIFSIVFCIVIVSIALQGSLIPAVAKHTKMIDADSDVMTTFSDFKDSEDMSFGIITVAGSASYQEEAMEDLVQHPLARKSKWDGRPVKEYTRTESDLLVMIQRGEQRIIPNGDTILHSNDVLFLLKRR